MDFTFDVGVSNKNFNQKPKRFCGYTFKKTNLSIQEFAYLIVRGHVFAHNYCSATTYSVKQKTIDNFDYTNVITLDLDDCPLLLDDLLQSCKYQPTIAFETMSCTAESNRYRFVYVFEEVIESNDDFKSRIDLILNTTFDLSTLQILTGSIDTSSFNVSQQFLGTTNDKQLIVNPGNIYSIVLLNEILHEDFNAYQDFYEKYGCNDLTAMKCPIKGINNKEEKGKTIAINSTIGTPIDIEEALSIVNSEHFKPTLHNYGDANLTPVKDPVYHYVGDLNIYAQKSYFNGGKWSC